MFCVNNCELTPGNFPDGTLSLRMPWNLPIEHDTNIIRWYYENDAELFTLICIKRYLDENRNEAKTILIMDYIPHARMDRVQQVEDVFTLKYFCEVINSLHFAKVRVLDPHSNVSVALLNNVVVESAQSYIKAALRKSEAEVVFFPDTGAMKRYGSMACGRPVAYGIKDRDWATGKILGYTLVNGESVNGKEVIIIDDICSRGNSFLYAARALKEAGAKKVTLYVTHLERTVLDGDMIKDGIIEEIYTAPTLACMWDVDDAPIPVTIV